ncbi:Inner membrane protein YiaH [compost metagenome]
MKNTDRNIGIDTLRVIACFMIVGIHSTPGFMNNGTIHDYINAILKSIYHVGLPVFFIISGYYALQARVKNIAQWYTKRVTRLLVPFIIISFIHFLYFKNTSLSTSLILEYLKLSITGIMNISIHFWFVYVIIAIYIAMPFISIVVSKLSANASVITLLAIISMQTLNSNTYLTGYFGFNLSADTNIGIFVWPLYFVLGGLYYKSETIIKKYNYNLILLVSFLVTALMTMSTPNIKGIDFHQFDVNGSMILYSSSLFLIFLNMKTKVSPKTASAIGKLSGLTYLIYLSHVMVLKFLYNNFPETTTYLQGHNLHIFITITAFIITAMIAFIVSPTINAISKKIENSVYKLYHLPIANQ